jgi:RNA polymerase sigma-70 factor, ECF subfamily
MPPAEPTERFYRELWPHRATVLRSAQFLTRSEGDAEDLAQEVLLKAFRHLDQLREGSDAKSWLMTILRNTRIDRLRATAGHARDIRFEQLLFDPVAEPAMPDDETWNDPQAILEEFSDRQVIDTLKQLPEDIRWTLLLVDVEGMDQADAATILDVPVGTIKSRLHRGRGMLREGLTPLAKELRMIR